MITTATKELFRLWMVQKRRAFTWKDVFIGAYFFGLFVFVLLGVKHALDETGGIGEIPFPLISLVPLLAVSIIPGDMMMKLFWRRSPVEMDDYLRSRPITPREWALLVLVDTKVGFLQWMLPLAISFAALLFMPFAFALLTFVAAYSCTLVNALLQNCWRRAPGNQYTLPLAFGYLFWLFLVYVLAGVAFVVIGLAADDPSEPVVPMATEWSTLVASLLLILLNSLVCFILHRYFARMKNHNEETHAPVTTTVRSLGQVSLWSIEWVQLLRSKRLRVSFFLIVVIFLLNTYMQQQDTIQQDMNGVNIMLMFGIAFPSIILAQWVMGCEANFCSGIWTKPWPVEGILRRKYVFFCAICCAMALLILPCVLWLGMSFWTLLCTLLFSCGIFVLPFMATCLYSSRMDLFASAFFNYQGANKQINVFSFVMFIPMGIYYASYFLLPHLYAHLLVGGLGILGILLHRPYIHWISTIWHRRRYQIMERWLAE